MTPKLIARPEDAAKFKLWIETRGGIAIWGSLDLSNPGASWSTPYLDKDGNPRTEKPDWAATEKPIRVITDADDVEVQEAREVKRFKIGTRLGRNGLKIKLTDASSERLRQAVAKAGKDAWYEFDYYSREAVIYVPANSIPLSKWQAVKTAVNS